MPTNDQTETLHLQSISEPTAGMERKACCGRCHKAEGAGGACAGYADEGSEASVSQEDSGAARK